MSSYRPYLGWGMLAGLGMILVLFGSQLANVAPDLYLLASKPYAWLAEPLNTARLGLGIPLLGALLLGLLGALAPCQLSTNAAALSWFAQDAQGSVWKRVGWFLLGKTLVYLTLAGIAVFVFGGDFAAPGAFFTGVRRVLGPLMLLLGFYLLGLIRMPIPTIGTGKLGAWARARGGSLGALALGGAFGLAFCPTMFLLFFGLMLPTAVASRLSLLFPALFAVGTAVPVLVILGLLDQGKPKGQVLSGMRRTGRWLNLVGGVVLVLVGLYDTLVYWFL